MDDIWAHAKVAAYHSGIPALRKREHKNFPKIGWYLPSSSLASAKRTNSYSHSCSNQSAPKPRAALHLTTRLMKPSRVTYVPLLTSTLVCEFRAQVRCTRGESVQCTLMSDEFYLRFYIHRANSAHLCATTSMVKPAVQMTHPGFSVWFLSDACLHVLLTSNSTKNFTTHKRRETA